MSQEELKEKAVSIKGKDYILVKDRITYFNEKYPKGAIETTIIRYDNGQVIVKATVYPDGRELTSRCFEGHSQAKEGDGMVNKMAALENAETSAVGRALAMMGIGILDSVASADEMAKASVAPIRKEYDAKDFDREVNETPEERDMREATDAAIDEEKTGPKCMTCGAPATFRSGVSKSGKAWSAYFCSTDDKTHARFV